MLLGSVLSQSYYCSSGIMCCLFIMLFFPVNIFPFDIKLTDTPFIFRGSWHLRSSGSQTEGWTTLGCVQPQQGAHGWPGGKYVKIQCDSCGEKGLSLNRFFHYLLPLSLLMIKKKRKKVGWARTWTQLLEGAWVPEKTLRITDIEWGGTILTLNLNGTYSI